EVDNKSTLDGATDAAKKLISEKVSFVIGGYNADSCIGMVDVLDKAYIPTIVCSNTDISLTNGRYCTYRLCKDDTFVASCMANHIKNKGDSTVAIISMKNDKHSESFTKYFTLACEKVELKVVKTLMLDKGLKDMRKSLSDIKDVSPESIYILADRDDAIDIVKNIRDMEITADISGSDMWEYKGVIDEAGSSAENIDFISFYDQNNTNTQASYDFIHGKNDDKGFVNYLLTNGQEEYVYPESALAYDAYMIIYNALLTANTTKLDDMLKCIDDITYEGASGVLSFDENGDVRQNKAYIKKINDKKVVNDEIINLDSIQ
ncbi:MAG: ABC transporter substrate-binding protein, partial [Lachnospiraceae bacterium]|nr:ABC transporter substrate-binding protein [Lachnospiraceae bacterium]